MGEGGGDVGEDGGGVGVDCGDDDGPGGVPVPPGERGREPPFFFFFLDVSASSATTSWFWSIDDKVGWGTNAFVRIAR